MKVKIYINIQSEIQYVVIYLKHDQKQVLLI
jgi:hypothetical protein